MRIRPNEVCVLTPPAPSRPSERHEKTRLIRTQLHFSSPEAFHDIYNPKLRWDKDPVQYKSVGANQSTVAQITYGDAKHRKDILKPLFSRRSVLGFQELIRRKVRIPSPYFGG